MQKDLIKKLQNKVKVRPVNSLGNIYPDDITEWLGISKKETKDFVEELHNQRVILYKFIFKCECGEICTAYENRLKRDGNYLCDICGKEYSINQIVEKMSIVYEIDREALLELEEENVDFRIIPEIRITDKVVPITKVREDKTMEIFMGSSSEAAEYMEEIAVQLEDLETKPLLWNATGKGIFIPSVNAIDSLIAIAERVDAAVFIFNADDKTWNGKSTLESTNTVRDNVLFEYGLFMGKLGKNKVCFICKGNPKLASDLKGITYINGDDGDYNVKSKIRDWINAIK